MSGLGIAAATAASGLGRAMVRFERAADRLAAGEVAPAVVLDLKSTSTQVAANAVVFRTSNRLLGVLLDTVA